VLTVSNVHTLGNPHGLHNAFSGGVLLRNCPPAPAARFANLRIKLKDSEGT
jgi:hypothetical protein